MKGMVPSRKKHETRSVFDVRETKKWWSEKTLDLKPKFRIRHPWIATLAGFLMIIIILIGVRRLFVRAEISDFSPASCLGTWQSPEKAQGQPESISASVPIDATDSAVMNGAAMGQIFCGTFVPPSTDETGDVRSVGLTLVWNITGLPAMSTTTVPSSTTDDASTSTDASIQTSTAPDVTTGAGATTSFNYHFSPFALFVSKVYAQDVTAQDATQTDSAPVSDATTTPEVLGEDTSTVILGPPLSATLTPVGSSSPSSSINAAATSTAETSTIPLAPPLPAPPIPDDSFLLISYSMDGNAWTPLQKVNASNWQNLTLSLPLTSWSDLKKLQIKIEGIPTTLTAAPRVLLDGMFMEVHYDVPPIALSGDNGPNASSGPRTVQVGANVTLDIPATEPLPFVPPPTFVAITKENGGVSVTLQYVDHFYDGHPINLFVYPVGTSASRNGAEGQYSFAGTPTEGPSVNAWPVSEGLFDPTTKQAVIEIVAPEQPDGQLIAADAMVSGTYAVDMSYFDSQTWHLVLPQTFTWP